MCFCAPQQNSAARGSLLSDSLLPLILFPGLHITRPTRTRPTGRAQDLSARPRAFEAPESQSVSTGSKREEEGE